MNAATLIIDSTMLLGIVGVSLYGAAAEASTAARATAFHCPSA